MSLYACVMSLILGFSSAFTSPWLYTRVFSLESIHVSYCPKVMMTYIFIYYSRAVYLLHFKEFINFISVPSSWCGADFILHPVRTPHLKSFLVTCTRRHHYTTQPSQCGHQQRYSLDTSVDKHHLGVGCLVAYDHLHLDIVLSVDA